jgi:diguanylate cyclase (GGDEF)-like protein
MQIENLKGNDEITDIARAFSQYSETINKQTRELSLLAMSDGLTGIANRRAWDLELKRQIQFASRFQKPLTIALIDVDFFKAYNDHYGHTMGDQALKEVAKIISHEAHRKADFVARYGGEEFVALLADTDEHGAQIIAEHLRTGVEQANIEHIKSTVAQHITVSIGLATCYPSHPPIEEKALLEQADKALYQAKNNGRNRIELFKVE